MQKYSKQEAREHVSRLVESFQKVEATLGDAQESQIENDYIRPLFRYLNWRTESAGLRMSEREVALVETDRHGKRPDYRFQLNGQHLFFVDAKKVKYRMHDPRWQWQVYRYAYSTRNNPASYKVDFGVLTDFQEFILLDCTFEARKPEAVNNFRVLDWRCVDYVTQFDRLWDIFERNNMLTASRDRKSGLWACYLSPKQAKANRVAPDEGFLNKLDNDKNGWRVRLAKDMKKCSPNLTGEVITAAVQLLIDRLVFIKTLSDRDIDDDYLGKLAECIEVNGLGEDDRGWFSAAKTVFDRLNRFYNGSIFKSQTEETVITSNRVVRDIIRELDPDNSPYDLSVMPVEILGTIYERFLGKVVRTTEQRVKIEDKPEVRKAGGVYYTPQYIVRYIVEQTVGKLLADCKTPDDVARLKILDPACGSGSFLIGAYDALIEWHKAYYAAKANPVRDTAYRDADGDIRLTAKLKRQILFNNIFGVDIDQQAVEVTRFSLSLKALETTRKDELDEEWDLFNETVLPDLKDNVVCGNSLIGTDILEGQLFEPIEERKLNAMNFKDKFPKIMGRGGFDAVIGNPPWVQAGLLVDQKPYFKSHYKTFSGNADLYVFFVERALTLLKTTGHFGYVVSNKWLRADYGKTLREYLSRNTNILSLIDFGELPVFQGVGTFPCVIFCTHRTDTPAQTLYTSIKRLPPDGDIEEQIATLSFPVDLKNVENTKWTLAPPHVESVLAKIRTIGVPLGVYCEGRLRRGVLTGYNPAFIVNEATRDRLVRQNKSAAEVLLPFVSGDETRRYSITWSGRYVILMRHGIDIRQYPSVAEHLAQYRKYLEPKRNPKDLIGRKHGNYRWYEIQDATAYYRDFDLPKIIYGQFQIAPHFCLTSSPMCFGSNHYMIVNENVPALHYLCGILNSRLYFFYMKRVAGVLGDADGGGRLISQKSHILQFPVRSIDPNNSANKARYDKIVRLVEQMLATKKVWVVAQTEKDKTYYDDKCKALDKQIDKLVYELYELTEEEVSIVEEIRC